MNNDLISREALKKAIIKRLGIRSEEYLLASEKTIYEEIDNAPTVPQVTVYAENASKEEIEFFEKHLEKVLKRPQGEQIAWEQGYECGKNEKRLQGEWKYETKFDGIGWWYCSNCCEHKEWIGKNPNFCPNCGADMRGEKNDG